MKVDVITVENSKFRRLCWWSNWVDVCLYDWAHTPYLLQMKVSRSNKKKFRSVRITGRNSYSSCGLIGSLTQMELAK
jgi:hypothetical protein